MTNLGIVIDIETTGLNPETETIIELGGIIFNRDTFEEISSCSVVFITEYSKAVVEYKRHLVQHALENPSVSHEQAYRDARFICDMHGKENGLFDIITNGKENSPQYFYNYFTKWMSEYGLGKGYILLPPIGSSIHFDIGYFKFNNPEFLENFLYRAVDVSTLKTMCDWWAPITTVERNKSTAPKKLHRSLSDCQDTLEELKFYKEHFIDRGNFSDWLNSEAVKDGNA